MRSPLIADDEVREIWRQEIRQLHRLAGLPGAREYIVGLHDSSEESNGFFLVLNPNQRLPLGAIRANLPTNHFLKQPKAVKNRLLIWHNLKRISIGLDILHTQGLLHRNLDEWAIFTDGMQTPDFQLSGFEWSIRLAGIAKAVGSRRAISATPVVHSFLQDWKQFGDMAAVLLGMSPSEIGPTRTRDISRDPTLHLSGPERTLLHNLIRADTKDRIDGDTVGQKIQAIVSSLEAIEGKRESQPILTCELNQDSPLSQAIRDASNRSIETDDIEAQLTFIREDLRDEPLLLLIKSQTSAEPQRYVLTGSRLTYRLSPFQPAQNRNNLKNPSWAIGYSRAAQDRPIATAIIQQTNLTDKGIRVMHLDDARYRYSVLQGKAFPWDRLAGNGPLADQFTERNKQHRALVLLQLLEALIIVADIWPVNVVQHDMVGDRLRLSLCIRRDDEREQLSNALLISAPSARMRDAFVSNAELADSEWVLTDTGILGERETHADRWRLIDIRETSGEMTIYEFDGSGSVPSVDRLFLRKADHIGEDKLLRRRIRALRALRDHVELLEMLDDPRRHVRHTHELPIEDEKFSDLDESKQEALRAIWSSSPLFLLQGPPGVGKTRLVREIVGRRIREDGNSRILLTAQSHHAVDHLLEEVSKELVGLIPEPLVVRTRSKDRSSNFEKYDLRQQARRIVSQFNESKLVSEAPAEFQIKVRDLVDAFTDSENAGNRKSTVDRSIEALLLRSAHFVFASTNSGDLERLVEEKAQFDWTIVEEAGKATGTELIGPLLLSHRRLMIGDHKQLPPFNADRLKKLLENPKGIAVALDVGYSLVSRPFRDEGMEEIIDDPSEDLTDVCSEAAAALMMFETLVENELELAAKSRSNNRLPIAKRLTHQHRMHPAIAELVSSSFYGDLNTDAAAVERFANLSPPFRIIDERRLPPSPIVVIDMPFVQSQMNGGSYESLPRFHNKEEVNAVVEVLSLLQTVEIKDRVPSLAVLSPYREQVKRLKHRIEDLRLNKLKNLDGFTFEGNAVSPTGTVDSFQGSEADIVVISMVRNNHHAGLRGLGFLADARRMNVLLSRAKWKLVLVVSLDFLNSKTTAPLPGGEFLKKMLDTLKNLQSKRDVNGIPLARVVKYNDIRRQK